MSTPTIRHPFSHQGLERFIAARNEPAWLSELRREAWARYERLAQDYENQGLFGSLEAWQDPPQTAIPSRQWPADLRYTIEERGDEEALIVHRDSTVLSRSLTKDSAKRGVIFTDLETAARTVPQWVQPALGKQVLLNDAATALNAAFWTGGSFLYVPEFLTIFLPFHVCHWMSAAHSTLFPRTLILIERGSRVFFMDEFLSPELAEPGYSSAIAEIQLAQDAQLDYIRLQNWSRNVQHEERLAAEPPASAQLRIWSANMGGPRSRVSLRLTTQTRGQQTESQVEMPVCAADASAARAEAEIAPSFERLLVQLPNEPVREKCLHYLTGKVTGRRRELTLQRASELHPEVRL